MRPAASLAASLAGAALLLPPEAAWAHAMFAGGEGFYAGLLHPLAVPAHLLALVGLGLFLGQREPTHARGALLAFGAALFAGLFAAGARLAPPPPAPTLLAVAALAGVLVAAAAPLPRAAGVVLASAAGAAIGLDSSPEASAGRGLASALAGTWAGAGLALLMVAQVAWEAGRPWHRIGVRVLGSWTAASALFVLALAMKR